MPRPDSHFDVESEKDALKQVYRFLSGIKILVTGNGRVSQGAQYMLNAIGANRLSVEEYINTPTVNTLSYCVASHEELVVPRCKSDDIIPSFITNPELYESNFQCFASTTDILLSCHFWDNKAPVYLSEEDLAKPDMRIKMIGDVTCDIKGSIKSTVRSSSHNNPFYDYNPLTMLEEEAFSNPNNICVMAVDTCPNAMPRVTSEYFGNKLIEEVLRGLLRSPDKYSEILERATILKSGKLTDRFQYLSSYVNSFIK